MLGVNSSVCGVHRFSALVFIVACKLVHSISYLSLYCWLWLNGLFLLQITMFSKLTLRYTYTSLKNSSTIEDNDTPDNPSGLPASESSALGYGADESIPILNVPEGGSARVESVDSKRKPADGDNV